MTFAIRLLAGLWLTTAAFGKPPNRATASHAKLGGIRAKGTRPD